jgi:hypothetical protein
MVASWSHRGGGILDGSVFADGRVRLAGRLPHLLSSFAEAVAVYMYPTLRSIPAVYSNRDNDIEWSKSRSPHLQDPCTAAVAF